MAGFFVDFGTQPNEILLLPEAVVPGRITVTSERRDAFISARSAEATERALLREMRPVLLRLLTVRVDMAGVSPTSSGPATLLFMPSNLLVQFRTTLRDPERRRSSIRAPASIKQKR